MIVHPIPDLETVNASTVQVSVLPHFNYSVTGNGIEQTITDNPKVWLEVTQANAIASPAQPAKVRLYRDGSLTQSLNLDFELGGTAVNGVHINSVPTSATIAAGQSFREITLTARSAGLITGPKVLQLRLASRLRYLLGNPHEGLIYIGSTAAETNGAGFDRWLQASTQGVITSLTHLADIAPNQVKKYLQAYALGLPSLNELGPKRLDLRIVNGRPELTTPGKLNAADVRWRLECSTALGDWCDATLTHVQATNGAGLKFTGPPLTSSEPSKFYRLNLSLDPGRSAAASIASLTGSSRYGLSGNGTWTTDPVSNHLTTAGGNGGETTRIITSVSGPVNLSFAMEILNGDWNDALTFYIDGIRQTSSDGAAVAVQQSLTGSHLLMWEFTKGTGQAVIKNLVP